MVAPVENRSNQQGGCAVLLFFDSLVFLVNQLSQKEFKQGQSL